MPEQFNKNLIKKQILYLANSKNAYQTTLQGVKMKIPNSIGAIAEYKELYWVGINDKATLQKFANIGFWQKLRDKIMIFKD